MLCSGARAGHSRVRKSSSWWRLIREFGVPGAGQSSWGPTVFAVTANDEEARRLIEWVRWSEHRLNMTLWLLGRIIAVRFLRGRLRHDGACLLL